MVGNLFDETMDKPDSFDQDGEGNDFSTNLFDETMDKPDSFDQDGEGNDFSTNFRHYYNLESGGGLEMKLKNSLQLHNGCLITFHNAAMYN